MSRCPNQHTDGDDIQKWFPNSDGPSLRSVKIIPVHDCCEGFCDSTDDDSTYRMSQAESNAIRIWNGTWVVNWCIKALPISSDSNHISALPTHVNKPLHPIHPSRLLLEDFFPSHQNAVQVRSHLPLRRPGHRRPRGRLPRAREEVHCERRYVPTKTHPFVISLS